jgi:hypothetical protein
MCISCLVHYLKHPTIDVARDEEIRKLRAFEDNSEYVPWTLDERAEITHKR